MDPEVEDDDTTCEATEGTLSQTGVLSLVWRKDVLGAAWVESSSSVLKFCQVADPAPEFRVMQSLKYNLDPTLIVTPSTSDPDYLDKLGGTCHPVAATATEAEDAEGAADPDEANGFMVTLCRNREFSAESAIQRLSLLRNLVDLPSCELSDRERQMHLEHILPPDQEQACRAVGGLLAYLQRTDVSSSMSISKLERYRLEKHLFLSPETFLSLGIFADRLHPSAHGGRAREGQFSVWATMNKTRSRPGARMLRGWFAQPSQDAELLSERHDTISFFVDPANAMYCAQLLPQLQTLLSKTKDVGNVQASFARGGLLLADYINAMSTAMCAVKVRDCLIAAMAAHDAARRLPIIRKVTAACRADIFEMAELVSRVVDIPASRALGKDARTGAHICVNHGVSADLDALRADYQQMENVLTDAAQYEQGRLRTVGLMAGGPEPGEELFVIYVPQLGFMLKMPMPRVLPAEQDQLQSYFNHLELEFQFDEDGEGYFKSPSCRELDEHFGDLEMRIKDLEAHLVRQLEQQVLAALPSLLAAQVVLAELDCLLSLAACARDLELVRPTMTEDNVLDIKQGRHPLLHLLVSQQVPNDCALGREGARDHATAATSAEGEAGEARPAAPERLLLLTGPNASGKTVYLRTMALITYLAHVGSFVPAEAATIGRTDAIYTRMQSRESAAVNASAFMIDLRQMATMLGGATPRTLCLIDEFGKGTNAQDGISLLYACMQHFLDRKAGCPKVLACTHYTELLDVRGFARQPGLALWEMQVMLQPRRDHSDAADASTTGASGNGVIDDVVFLHRAVPGTCSDSFGWSCAAHADMPEHVVARARQISLARSEGRPLLPPERDDEQRQLIEQQQAGLVDGFLAWDFDADTAATFFAQQGSRIQQLVAAR